MNSLNFVYQLFGNKINRCSRKEGNSEGGLIKMEGMDREMKKNSQCSVERRLHSLEKTSILS